jgi:uncharacterized protein DUF4190
VHLHREVEVLGPHRGHEVVDLDRVLGPALGHAVGRGHRHDPVHRPGPAAGEGRVPVRTEQAISASGYAARDLPDPVQQHRRLIPDYPVETRRERCEDRGVTSPPRYATEQERSVPLAPVALAMAVLVAPLGVVLGVIALRRIRRDNETGAGTAKAAIAVGTVVTIAYLALAVAMIVLLVELHDAAPLPPGLRT